MPSAFLLPERVTVRLIELCLKTSRYIIKGHVVTIPRNCIWRNVEITAKKHLLIQLVTTDQILSLSLSLSLYVLTAILQANLG